MSLADRQAELVAALVAGGPDPAGFDTGRLTATRAALLSKRAAEVARVWPRLAAAHGDGWNRFFAEWATGRPTRGSLRDGWDLARDHPPAGAALVELRMRDAVWIYRVGSPPRRRRLPWIGVCHDGARRRVLVQIAGRVRSVL